MFVVLFVCLFLFFFFQAEDGIRDRLVTGVQTCALPIFRLNRAFCTNSICTPSRASILTGKYGHHNGVFTLDDNFDRNQPNVAKHLQKAGYETAIIGKWHLHTEPSGFDYYNVLPNQGRYFDPYFKESGKEWKDRSEGGEVSRGYVTDIITDKTIDWLKNRRSDKPFFLMCHHKATHGLWETSEERRVGNECRSRRSP